MGAGTAAGGVMRKAARIDSTARDLTQVARQLGAKVLVINGVIDAVVAFRGHTYAVDWKGPKTPITLRQEYLVASGFPLHFVSTREELTALLFSREG